MGRPDEYAKLAVAIIENPMLNGGTIRLDAGQRFARARRVQRRRREQSAHMRRTLFTRSLGSFGCAAVLIAIA